MANISVYDSVSGITKTVTVDIGQAAVKGVGTGTAQFYVTVFTGVKNQNNETIDPIIVTSFGDNLTTEIKAAIVALFNDIVSDWSSSSSSEGSASSSKSSVSSQSSKSSQT